MSIFNKSTRFLVLDIETAKQSNDIIFDISFGIYSQKEGKIGSIGYIVKENEKIIPYYADRLKRYADYVQAGKYQIQPFARIMKALQGIISKYNVKYATAYNSAFDFSRIENTCQKMEVVNHLAKMVELDMYHMACQTLGKQKNYKRFIDSNDLKTEKGNRKSGAETMFQYMEADIDFVEEHTGLADIEIEMEILAKVLRQKKKMDIGRNSQSWRLVQG
jgi:hypothetical protein